MGPDIFWGREKFAVVWEIILFIRAVGENPNSIDLTYFLSIIFADFIQRKKGKRKGEKPGGGSFFLKQHLSNNGGLSVGGFTGSFLKWAKLEKNRRVWLTSGNGENGYRIYIVDWIKWGGVLKYHWLRKGSYLQCLPLILEIFFQPIVLLYVLHGDGYRRRNIPRIRPYYSHGVWILI